MVRLNEAQYSRKAFLQAGINHLDLYFTDCSMPKDEIAHKFLCAVEACSGCVAVHCAAGLGRTGTLIALYMMKHHGFTAREIMAWLRIARPGSIIGPQQGYLQQQEKRMHALGTRGLPGLALSQEEGSEIRRQFVGAAREGREGGGSADDEEGDDEPSQAQKGLSRHMAEMVSQGAQHRAQFRSRNSNSGGKASRERERESQERHAAPSFSDLPGPPADNPPPPP